MPSKKTANTAQVSAPELFYAEMTGVFYKEARKRGFYSGDDVFAPELISAGGDFTNVVLLNDRIRDSYKGKTAAYYYSVAELHLYAGAYYTHCWSLDHESVKSRDFAIKFLRSGAYASAEPHMALGKKETEDFCAALYALFAQKIEPYAQHEDLGSYIYYGMNAFFAVSVSITAKRMGMEGQTLPMAGLPSSPSADSLAESPAQHQTPNEDNDTSAASNPDAEIEEWPEIPFPVQKASISFAEGIKSAQPDTPDGFWVDMMSEFISHAKRAGCIDGDEPFPRELVRPGVDFTYALMTSRPYYGTNKHDMKRYYYKIARHCFYAGAYYAYLWDKQSNRYLEDDFHLELLRADLPATAAPLMVMSREEVSQYCLELYLKYMDLIAQYAARPDYPVYVSNGMHAFYMIGMSVQLNTMQVGERDQQAVIPPA